MASLAPFIKASYFDSNGAPLAGGKLYSYAAGTSTPLSTYTDNTGNTANANPVILDANGQANVWLSDAAYKFILKDSNDVTQWTVDQVSNFGEAPTSLYRWAGTATGSANAITLTPTTTLTAYTPGIRFAFLAGNSNSGATTVNISSLGVKDVKDQAGAALVGGEIISGRLYTITYDGTNFILTDVLETSIPYSKLNADTRDLNILNYSLTAVKSSNTLIISLKDAAGSDASSSSAVRIPFRSTTATTGTPTVRSVTAALSVTIPSGGTLGHQDAVDQNIYVWAIDNSGTVELAVSGSRNFDEMSLQSTTIITTPTDYATLYSTTARTSKPIRLLGRIVSNQATAGTYASDPTEIALGNILTPEVTQWTQALSASFSEGGFGTVVAGTKKIKTRRVGDSLEVHGYWVSGNTTASTAQLQLPSGYTIDSDKLGTQSHAAALGVWFNSLNTGSYGTSNLMGSVIFDGSATDYVYFTYNSASTGQMSKFNGNIFTNGTGMHFFFTVPLKRFRSY